MEVDDRRVKVRRQKVEVYCRTGQVYVHDICDLAMPSPDGRFFVVRDLSKGEIVGRKGDSVDSFYPTDTVDRIVVTGKLFYLMPNGDRGEEVLDNAPKSDEIIPQED